MSNEKFIFAAMVCVVGDVRARAWPRAGSYWGAASAETKANSSVGHPAMVGYGPVP
jgi:hypothetical protein